MTDIQGIIEVDNINFNIFLVFYMILSHMHVHPCMLAYQDLTILVYKVSYRHNGLSLSSGNDKVGFGHSPNFLRSKRHRSGKFQWNGAFYPLAHFNT